VQKSGEDGNIKKRSRFYKTFFRRLERFFQKKKIFFSFFAIRRGHFIISDFYMLRTHKIIIKIGRKKSLIRVATGCKVDNCCAFSLLNFMEKIILKKLI